MQTIVRFFLLFLTPYFVYADVSYELTYHPDKCHIEAEFINKKLANKQVELSPTFFLLHNQQKQFSTFTAIEGAIFKDKDNKEIVTYSSRGILKLSYDIIKSMSSDYFLFLIGNKEFGLLSTMVLPLTEKTTAKNQKVTFKINIPNDYSLVTSIPNKQHSTSNEITLFGNVSQILQQNFFVVGSKNGMKIVRIYIEGKPSDLVFLNVNQDIESDITTKIRKVYTSQRALFGQRRFSPLSVFIGGLSDDDSLTSVHLGGGMLYSMRGNQKPDVDLIAHEHMHNYINYDIIGHSPTNTWYTEGFTDYYAAKTNFVTGIISLQEYVDTYNGKIVRNYCWYHSGKLYSDIAADGKSDTLSYVRGYILAAELDYRIQKATNGQSSLDDIIAKSLKTKKFSMQILKDQFKALTGEDSTHLFDSILEKGDFSALSADLILGAMKGTNKIFVPDLGFDYNAATKNNRGILKLDKTTAAYKAGLRDGDKMEQNIAHSSWSYKPGCKFDAKFTIMSPDGMKKEIKYLAPAKAIQIPEYRICSE